MSSQLGRHVVPPATFRDVLGAAEAAHPDNVAVSFPGHHITYREIQARAGRIARALRDLGVVRGSHVGLLMDNAPEWLFSFFAVQSIGAVAVPINSRYRVSELRHICAHANLRVIITNDASGAHTRYSRRLADAFPDLDQAPDPSRLALPASPELRAVFNLGDDTAPGCVDGARFLLSADGGGDDPEPAERPGPDDIALILYTSGTTAQPKGCLLTNGSVVATWAAVARRLTLTAADRVFNPLPLFHMGGIGPMLSAFSAGARIVNQPHFDSGQALELIECERVTWLYTMFPPVTLELINDPSFAQRDLSSVRALMNVAPSETLDVISRAFPAAVHLAGPFGMTEASGAITCNDFAAEVLSDSADAGPPLPGTEVIALDPVSGVPLPPGEAGELCVRGPGLFVGYYRDDAGTRAAIDERGWLRSGDLGSVDADGHVRYQGRIKEMIKVGGENVAPAELEAHLSSHPAIKLAQVVGAPDALLGEVPVAFVELKNGSRLTESEIIDYCRGSIAGFKVPRQVRFVTEWPMSATKIQKFVLRQALAVDPDPAPDSVGTRTIDSGSPG